MEYFDRISDNLDILDALDLHDCEFPRRSSTHKFIYRGDNQ